MRPSHGFTLIELLVAVALLAIFIISILGLLDSSQRVAKTESALADVQENVRYAAYHLLRTARMVGGTSMPFAHDEGGADVWVAAQLQDGVTTFTDDFGGSHTAVAGSDVLTLRGFFDVSPYFVNPTRSPSPDLDWVANTVTIREDVSGDQEMDVVAAEFVGRGIVFMGRGQYAVSRVTANTAPTGGAGSRTFTITFEDNPPAPWSSFNRTGLYVEPTFQVFRVGILDSCTYYVSNEAGREFQLTRVRAAAGGTVIEPVAVNIGNLQVYLGVDTADPDTAIDQWYPAPTVAEASDPNTPVAIEVTVLGRTPDRVLGWREPDGTFEVRGEMMATADRQAKWRRMQATAMLRDFVL